VTHRVLQQQQQQQQQQQRKRQQQQKRQQQGQQERQDNETALRRVRTNTSWQKIGLTLSTGHAQRWGRPMSAAAAYCKQFLSPLLSPSARVRMYRTPIPPWTPNPHHEAGHLHLQHLAHQLVTAINLRTLHTHLWGQAQTQTQHTAQQVGHVQSDIQHVPGSL
jgi:hypothetical protein